MSIEITPTWLEFKAPLTESSTEFITIKNNSSEVAAFKVKTTAPKLYCVRPNAATLQPGEMVDVSVILLGLKEEPADDYVCNHKFLIVALPSPYDLGENSVSDVWPKLEAEFKDQSVSKKIKVRYVKKQDQQPASSEASASEPVSTGSNLGPATRGSLTQRSAAATGAEAKSAIQQQQQELSDEKSKIDSLNEKLESNESATKSTAPSTTPATATATKSASPLPIVLLVALIAFIIGWLFF